MSPNFELVFQLLPLHLVKTLYMVFASGLFGLLFGLPLGIILALTSKGHLKENIFLHKTLESVVNIGRSFPFAILMIALIPFTRSLTGTSLGTTAAIVPLSIAAIPFLARLIETNLLEIERSLIEAAIVMGSSTSQIVRKVLLPEALPSIISSMTLTLINLIGYSAMAGLVGGGGLGQVAIQYGYHRYNTPVMIATVVLLIILVQLIQWVGNSTAYSILKKRGKR